MRSAVVSILIGIVVGACAGPSTGTDRVVQQTPLLSKAVATATRDPVLAWNRVLLQTVRTPGVQPSTIHPTRSFAMMHAAIFDAVNAVD